MEPIRPCMNVGLVVRDLEVATAFYRDMLGMEVGQRVETPAEVVRRAGIGEGAFALQYMKVGEADLLLIQMKKEPPTAPKWLEGGPGFKFINMWVKDLEKTYADLKAKGVNFLSEPIRTSPEVQFVYLKDPEGNIIELLST